MRLLSLRVGGFGRLTPGEYRFADRALVVAGNAAGKSTLAAALRAALYGLEGDRRRQRGLTDHEAHRPWRGDAYAVGLTVETREGLFVVERDFARVGGGGQLAVRDGAGLDVTSRFLAGKGRDRVGELLLGVGEPTFLRAVFAADRAGGPAAADGDPGELTDLLGRAVASDEGSGPAAAALAACDEALQRYEGVTVKGPARVDTEIQRLEQRLGEIRADREGTQARHEESLAALRELEGLRADLDRLDAGLAINRRRRLRAQAALLRRQLEARRGAQAELEAAREAVATRAHLSGFPPGREPELATWAERCAAHDREATARRRQADEVLRPDVERVEAELAAAGAAGAGVTAELATGVAALLEREARVAELTAEREAARARIAGEGEDLALHERLHAGLARLGETERRFLRDQERLGFARDEQAARLERDERDARAATAAWDAAAARLGRGRAAAAIVAGVALAGGIAALALAPADATGPAAWLPGGLALLAAVAAAAACAWQHRRRAALARRRELQGTQRLAALAAEREELAVRETARRARLAEIAPALLGPREAAALAPDPDDLDVLCRRHESFRIRHDAWFRAGERLAEEQAEIARLRARLAPFVEGAADAKTPPATAALQAELARRQRIAELADRALRGREALAAAAREAAAHDERADEAARRAAALLAVLPPGCRFEAVAGEPPATPAASTNGVVAALAPLAAAFRRDPAAAADWYAARAAEAAEARRLADETIPALARRLGDLPAPEELERALATVEGELALVATTAAAAAAAGAADAPVVVVADTTPETLSVDELLAQGEALQARRDTLAAGIAERAREVAHVERERRAHLPELAQRERELVAALGRARDFRDAVTLARDTIARLAGDVHARWARRLDEDAGRLATLLCPEIAAIAFTPDLDWAVTLPDGRRLEAARADRQLSSGVRDQLALAVRLALSRFLALPGEPLPLVLDDPFARYDDARFHRAMNVLLQEAAGHQVILLTCHEERLRWLEQLDPVVARAWTRVELGAGG